MGGKEHFDNKRINTHDGKGTGTKDEKVENRQVKRRSLTEWLPTTKKETELRGWDNLDVILFSGDAYVDHPSFGVAVIGRVIESLGLRVAIVPQPDWHGDYRDFK